MKTTAESIREALLMTMTALCTILVLMVVDGINGWCLSPSSQMPGLDKEMDLAKETLLRQKRCTDVTVGIRVVCKIPPKKNSIVFTRVKNGLMKGYRPETRGNLGNTPLRRQRLTDSFFGRDDKF